jgi:hypothetical protein
MAFKLRSQDGASPVRQVNFATLQSQYNSFQKDDNGNYTRTYEVKNENVHRNRKEAKIVAADLYNRALSGENSTGYAGGKKGGYLSPTVDSGDAYDVSTGFSNNYNAPSKREIFKTLNKRGGADIVDGVVTPKDTHTETKTINAKQYELLGKKVAWMENKLSASNLARENKKKELELKKQQLAEKKQAKLNSYLASKNKKTN